MALAISTVLSPHWIRFPETEEELAQNAREFRDLSGYEEFDMCVGAVDGTHFDLWKRPSVPFAEFYMCRHTRYCVVLSACVDAKKRFIHVPSILSLILDLFRVLFQHRSLLAFLVACTILHASRSPP